jgi:predicted nucleotidyltransferase
MSAEARNDVLQCLKTAMPELRRRFRVRSLSIFGSVARGEAEEGSDVDVLVEFEEQVGLFQLARLRRHLIELLGRPVDLGTPASLRPRIRSAALDEAVRVA